MKCYISSSCTTKGILPDVLNRLIDLGFKKIELTGNIKYSENIYEVLFSFKDIFGIDFLMHNYFPFGPNEFVLNLASRNPDIKNKTIKHIKNAVDILKKLGKDLYSIHPGFVNDLLPILRDYWFIKADDRFNNRSDFYQTIETIINDMVEDDFKIAIENLHPKSSFDLYSFLCTPDDIENFLEYFVDSPNVGILLDLGHLNIASRKLKFDKYKILDMLFNSYSDRIFQIHISENDGSDDSHGVCEPDSWQIEYIEGNKKYLRDVPVVMEWHNILSKEAFERYELIRESLEGEER